MLKGSRFKISKRQALENMLKPIPKETKGDPDVYKKWKAIWKEGKNEKDNSNRS